MPTLPELFQRRFDRYQLVAQFGELVALLLDDFRRRFVDKALLASLPSIDLICLAMFSRSFSSRLRSAPTSMKRLTSTWTSIGPCWPANRSTGRDIGRGRVGSPMRWRSRGPFA